MHLEAQAEQLRIYVGESDKFKGRPLHEAILELARAHGLAGGTVMRALAGFGAHSKIHTAKILQLSQDLPVVIEIIDTPQKIEAFLPELDPLITEGMVTVSPIRVLLFRAQAKA